MSKNQINTVEQLKSIVNIGDFIGKYVKLTQKNNKLLGLCPFHNEKTPSFNVLNDFYYCFGCHATGDVIKFVQDYHNVSFVDGVKKIADDIGVVININQENVAKKEENERKHAILQTIKEYYQKQLRQKLDALNYLTKKRKLTLETIANFEIGFSPSVKNQLYKYLIELKYSVSEILGSGVIREYGTSHYDFFDGRIIIPIKDSQGQTIGFGGRVFNNETTAKYVNSAESDLFKKREILFNFTKAKQAKMKDKNCPIIMVEGYMDVIMMSQFGFNGGIAPLGTGITEQQIKMALGIDKEVLFCFNSDTAGQNASLKIAQILAKILTTPNLTPKFINLEPFKDVDELLNSDQKNGTNLFKQRIGSAYFLNDFLWSIASKNIDKSDPNKMAIMEDNLIKFAQTIPNVTIQKSYIRFFKQKIFELSRNKNKQQINAKNIFVDKAIPNALEEAERYIISLFVVHPALKQNEEIGIENIIDSFSDLARKSYHIIAENDDDSIINELNRVIDSDFFEKIQKIALSIKCSAAYIKNNNLDKFFTLSLEKIIAKYVLIRLNTDNNDDINMIIAEQARTEERIREIDEEIDKISNY